ncbi:MAG: Asp-tRNA(Asn)/Glu-tRNA(Gln) amidotransferase subunit GatC [Bifidobacteriaceae bacterium]|jgi:aspartyl-tRNA(Asn)/glutamyl-tRNA(Gln) amidotransferase subunit C|nr:Asp-tRNA(Asn)/Glu-tRNA(Gln) amidotransferase subunit GatC [Bifidobacteriaceae bacterium]
MEKAETNFSVQKVKHLADLARIEFSEQELDELTSELNVISDAINKVQEVANDDVERTTHPFALENVFRKDAVGETLEQKSALAAAPKQKDGMFLVPQILAED